MTVRKRRVGDNVIYTRKGRLAAVIHRYVQPNSRAAAAWPRSHVSQKLLNEPVPAPAG